LKALLEAKQRGMAVAAPDGSGPLPHNANVIPSQLHQQQTLIEEKVVVQEVIKHTGLTEEQLKEEEKKSHEEIERFRAANEEEKKMMLAQKAMVEQQARMLEQERLAKEAMVNKELEDLTAIQAKIAEREKQLLVGGQHIDAAKKQKQQLKATEQELRLRREQDEKLRLELEEARERELFMVHNYSSKEEELKATNEMLKELWAKLAEKKATLEDLTEEFEMEREDYVDTIRALDRQLRLKNLLVSSFVPPMYVDAIEHKAQWDEYNDCWFIPGMDYAGNHIDRSNVDGVRRREATSLYMEMDGGAGAMGKGAAFDPTRANHKAQDMQARLAALSSMRRGPPVPYFTYGDVGGGEAEHDAGSSTSSSSSSSSGTSMSHRERERVSSGDHRRRR